MLNALPTPFADFDPALRARLRTPRTLLVAAAAVALVGSAALPASAAPGLTDADTTQANVVVNSAIALTALTPSFTLTGVPGATVEGIAAVTFNVLTNNRAGYAVTVQAEDDVLSPQAAGNPDSIPIANLGVRETGSGGGYTPLSDTTPVTVHTQATRSALTGDVLSNDYQVDIPFVNEDTYSVTLDYIATTL